MVFNSYIFLFSFLPLTLSGYFIAGKFSREAAMTWLAGASIYFYSYWSVPYLSLLLASIFLNYILGLSIIELRKSYTKQAKFLVIGGISLNLSVLMYFKYFNFFIANISSLLGGAIKEWTIILPLGISFYTFTQIAFLVDAYVGKVKEKGIIEYILFVTYFPHLIAGPILHHTEMLSQFVQKKCVIFNWRNISLGLSLFALGLSKKVIIADNIAPFADAVFSFKGSLSFVPAWMGALAYTLQIYFDFSGYSDMAIGLSKLFNVDLPLNFYSPYKAHNIIEFWRRWHITLSRFLRDYLYIPLGGNRRGQVRQYLNLGATMLLGGLWHGASWTFVIWGGLHGIYLFFNHAMQAVVPSFTLNRLVSIPITFTAVVIAWVFFRATDITSALNILLGMTGYQGFYDRDIIISGLSGKNKYALTWILLGLIIVWGLPNTQQIFRLSFVPKIEGVINNFHNTFFSERSQYSRVLYWRRNVINVLFYSAIFIFSLLLFMRTSHFLYFQF